MSDPLLSRVSGSPSAPALVYLPGIHGDWTPLHHARIPFGKHVRLIEVAYPRMPAWRLADYARALTELLDSLKVERVHLAAESFGSLVAWEFALKESARIESLIVVGGFARTPDALTAAIAHRALSLTPSAVFESIVDAYATIRRRRIVVPEMFGEVRPYGAVRTREGHRATVKRLELVKGADYSAQLAAMAFPVRYIGGASDRVVPVAREVETLERLLPAEARFESHLIPNAPHMIVTSHPAETVGQIAAWVRAIERPNAPGIALDRQEEA